MRTMTNHHWRNFSYGYELTPKELSDFDWLEDPTSEYFIRYRGSVYALSEFTRVGSLWSTFPVESPFNQWDGYTSDNAFCATVIRLDKDCERYQIGRILS